jgi:DNA processing protein
MPEIRTYHLLDAEYPEVLRELTSPPEPLCVRGRFPRGEGIAIVGTRQASPGALTYTRQLAFRLAKRGITIWSGGALGIDAAAHGGTLEAGGSTVAVLGTGFDFCYPPEHAALYEEIVVGGGSLLSPFTPAQPPTLWTFPQRNITLAALTRAVIIVQAPLRSGARMAASAARKLKRDVYVVPSAPWDETCAGNRAELERGAKLLPDDDTLVAALARQPPPFSVPVSELVGKDAEELSPACRSVLAAARRGPVHLDDLCVLTGLSPPLLQEALLTLTLQAVLVEGPSGCYRRVSG